MVTYLNIVLGHLLTWLAFAAGAVYAGMVLVGYRMDGPHYRLSFQLQDPARSEKHLLVWLGVKVLQCCLRIGTAILNTLLEASAEVGERFIHLSPAAQEMALRHVAQADPVRYHNAHFRLAKIVDTHLQRMLR